MGRINTTASVGEREGNAHSIPCGRYPGLPYQLLPENSETYDKARKSPIVAKGTDLEGKRMGEKNGVHLARIGTYQRLGEK